MAPFPIGTFVETFLDQSKDDARRLIRHEMESMLDPLVESLFNQLKDKFVHYLEDSSISDGFHQEHQIAHDREGNGQMNRHQQTILNAHPYHCKSLSNVHSINANCQLNSTNHQAKPLMSIKQQISDPSNVLFEPQHNHHSINSSSTHELSIIPSTVMNDQSLTNIEIQQQPQPKHLAHIKHNHFEDECDCDECVDGGIEVKKEDDDDQVDEESSRPVKRPKIDTTQPNNAIHIIDDDMEHGDGVQSRDDSSSTSSNFVKNYRCISIDTRATIGEYSGNCSNESMVIQQSIGEVSNCLPQNELTQRPYAQQINFDDDLEISQETLDKVKREIEEEEEMKRRENEHEGGDERLDEGDRVESELSEAIDTQESYGKHFQQNDDETEIDNEEYEMEVDDEESSEGDDETEVDEQLDQVPDDRIELHRNAPKVVNTRATFGEHNSNESMVIQQEEMNANNAIGGESIATECTTNPIQPNRHLQCSRCPKSFIHNSALQRHLRVHTGERPFQCDLCDNDFKGKYSLTTHQLTHQNIKRFRCQECDKQFTQKHRLDSRE